MGKYTATSVYVAIQTSIPSLLSYHDKNIFKNTLLSKHLTTYIGNKIKDDTDADNTESNADNSDSIIQSSMYFEPKKVIKQYELSITSSNAFIDITSDLRKKNNIDQQYIEMNNLLIKLKNHWNVILSNINPNYSPFDIKDNITLNTCSNNDCNLNTLLKYDNEKENDNKQKNKDIEGMRSREKKRYQPFSGGNKLTEENYNNRQRHLYLEPRSSSSNNNKEEQNINTNNFYYILLPLNITFEYYIPTKHINYENIFYSMEDILMIQQQKHDDDDNFWIDFYNNLLLILGYIDNNSSITNNNSSSSSTSMIIDVSLSYKSQNINNNNDKNNNNDNIYNDDDGLNLRQSEIDYYFDPTIFKDILQSFIAMFVILSICLILVYCGKFQDRRKRQKIVPFDGSIPQEI